VTKSQEADRNWQLGAMSDSHVRCKSSMRTIVMQARQLSALVKMQESVVTGRV